MAMTTKRIASFLFGVGSLLAACGTPTPVDSTGAEARPPEGTNPYESLDRIGDLVRSDVAASERGARAIEFPEGAFVRPHFRRLLLEPGARLVLEGEGGESRTLTPKDNGSGVWGPTFDGRKITLRLERDGEGAPGSYEVDKVGVGYPEPEGDATLGPLATMCGASDLVAPVCFITPGSPYYSNPGAYAAAASVAQLRFYLEGVGIASCTGWLISADGLLLTNYHCIPNQITADSVTTIFNHQPTRCPADADAAPKKSLSGATFIKGSAELDYALLRLHEVPLDENPGGPIYYPGLPGNEGFLKLDPTSAITKDVTEFYIPQHQSHKRKFVAVNDSEGGGTRCRIREVGIFHPGDKPGVNVGYRCDTDSGASGAPLLAAGSNKAIALHHRGIKGACSATSPYNLAVPIREIYPQIRCVLDPSQPCNDGGGGAGGSGGSGGSGGGPNSCVGRCGPDSQAPGGCWCDPGCEDNPGGSDCCADKIEICDTPAAPDSCKNRCGEGQQAPDGCYCDPSCQQFDDCCDDFPTFCL